MGKKILIVDDSQTIRQQASFTLSRGGYNSITAGDGIEGLEALKNNPDVALMILDMNMPNMNGMEMLQKLKEKNIQIPIIVLTTEGDVRVIEEAHKLGAKVWMTKPFQAPHLLAAIKKIVGE